MLITTGKLILPAYIVCVVVMFCSSLYRTGPPLVWISAVSKRGARYHTVPVYFYFWCALMLQLSERRSSHIITFGLGGVSASLCPLAARWSSRVSVEPGLRLSSEWNFLRTCFSARDGLADKNKPRWPMEVMRVPTAETSSAPARPSGLWGCVAWQPAFPLSAGWMLRRDGGREDRLVYLL